jgi:hypothetical protein
MRRKSLKQKKGQFIIIAILFIATMIISIGAMLSSTLTYYRYEPWEEYITVIDAIKLNSLHLVELSLSNYTLSGYTDPTILFNNLDEWKNDLIRFYPSYGISLNYESVNGIVYNRNPTSSSIMANVTFYLNVTSLGLTGYKFNIAPILNLTVLNPNPVEGQPINVTITTDEGNPIFDLQKNNFKIINGSINSVTKYYHENYSFAYSINYNPPPTSPITISVCDNRGIRLLVP